MIFLSKKENLALVQIVKDAYDLGWQDGKIDVHVLSDRFDKVDFKAEIKKRLATHKGE